MGVIAIALKHMFAAGMEHAAILSAIEEMEAASAASVQVRTARQERNARYYAKKASEKRLNASYSDVSDASSSLPLEESSPTPPKTQTPSLFQKDIPPKGGISKKVSLPPENPLLPESQPVAGNGRPAKADKRGTRIPEHWEFGDAERETAAKFGIVGKQARAEFEHFHDHWLISTKADAVKKSWPVAWRMWCRNTIKFAQRRNNYPNDRPTKPKFRNGFAELLYDMHMENKGIFDDKQDRSAEPEILSPSRNEPGAYRACGPDIRGSGGWSDEQVVVDFAGYRAVS